MQTRIAPKKCSRKCSAGVAVKSANNVSAAWAAFGSVIMKIDAASACGHPTRIAIEASHAQLDRVLCEREVSVHTRRRRLDFCVMIQQESSQVAVVLKTQRRGYAFLHVIANSFEPDRQRFASRWFEVCAGRLLFGAT